MPSAPSHSWSPYAVGAGIGVLSWFAFLSADHPLGITTALEHTAAAFLGTLGAAPAAYLADSTPTIGWEWALVIGVFLGAFGSAYFAGDREHDPVPPVWRERFGGSRRLRYLAAFGGGALMVFGARLAGGCTTGHAVSGTLQLAASSWMFAITLFASAIATAHLLYGSVLYGSAEVPHG